MINDETKKKYLEADGYICPFCGGDNLDAGRWEAPVQEVACQDCGKSWTDIYQLVDVEEKVD